MLLGEKRPRQVILLFRIIEHRVRLVKCTTTKTTTEGILIEPRSLVGRTLCCVTTDCHMWFLPASLMLRVLCSFSDTKLWFLVIPLPHSLSRHWPCIFSDSQAVSQTDAAWSSFEPFSCSLSFCSYATSFPWSADQVATKAQRASFAPLSEQITLESNQVQVALLLESRNQAH